MQGRVAQIDPPLPRQLQPLERDLRAALVAGVPEVERTLELTALAGVVDAVRHGPEDPLGEDAVRREAEVVVERLVVGHERPLVEPALDVSRFYIQHLCSSFPLRSKFVGPGRTLS